MPRISSQHADRRLSTVYLRDDITVEQLQELKQKFADGSLNGDEFVEFFITNINPTLSQIELAELFQKIDVNCDGTVDWDEFTNFLFLSGSKESQIDGADMGDVFCLVPKLSQMEVSQKSKKLQSQPNLSRVLSSHHTSHMDYHKEAIMNIRYNAKNNQYITGAKDGKVQIWSGTNLTYISTLARRRDWISDCAIMYKSNTLVVCSMERSTSFYDLATSECLGETTDNSRDQPVPLCVDYIDSLIGDGKEAITIGDDGGGITLLKCSNFWGQQDICNVQTNAFSTRTRSKKHKDWITRVRWVNEIGGIVSCSLDSNIIVTDVERMTEKFQYSRHSKEVHDVAWSSVTRLMASCGMDRTVSLWNPFSSERAVAVLKGHNAGVFHLCCDDANNRVISLSSDNVFKVWDLRNFRCIQTFEDNFKETGGADHKLSAALYDNRNHVLISATHRLSRWKLQTNETPKSDFDYTSETRTEKEHPLLLVAYNTIFNQVVTAEMSPQGLIRTWNAATGEEISSFSNTHGDDQVTAMTFDTVGRRLITGGHKGASLKAWNFSNGAQIKTFSKSNDGENNTMEKKRSKDTVNENEISCVVYVERNVRAGTRSYLSQRFVCCAGWDRHITVWSDTTSDDDVTPEYRLPRQQDKEESVSRLCHTDDILSAIYISPDWIVTGGSDGKVLAWSLRTTDCIGTLCQSSIPAEILVYCRSLEILFVAGEGRNIYCVSMDFLTVTANISLNYPTTDPISAIACNTTGSLLVCGDNTGTLVLWDLFLSNDALSLNISPSHWWRQGYSNIVKVLFAESHHLSSPVLLVSCGDGTLSMWSASGVLLGIYGNSRRWKIEKLSLSTVSSNVTCASDVARASGKKKVSLSSISVADIQGSIECVPHIHEVWVCVSEAAIYKWLSTKSNEKILRTSENQERSSEKLTPMLCALHALSQDPNEVINMITIEKSGRENIEVYDGMQTPPVSKSVVIADFVKDIGWVKQRLLSKYIGRYFKDRSGEYFKVRCMALTPSNLLNDTKRNMEAYILIDENGKSHDLQPLSAAVSLLSHCRSLPSDKATNPQDSRKKSASRPQEDPKKTAHAKLSLSKKEDGLRGTDFTEGTRERYRTLSSLLPPIKSANNNEQSKEEIYSKKQTRHDLETDTRHTYEPTDISRFSDCVVQHRNRKKYLQS